MLGFHKQMDNRIKLLDEILSFRMQGVEFDNGDMYVDGHMAASDVRDEFVSVTEKLMDELAQCYNVLSQIDINNTIDHRPEWDEKWFLENEKTALSLHDALPISTALATSSPRNRRANSPSRKRKARKACRSLPFARRTRSEEHTSELQSQSNLVCLLLREKKDEKWFLENEKTVTQFCRKLAAERP